ncbi:hypothetical protein FA95DRAFT_1567181 [Auriscalpium vulgare]|uniref:Uncharacterized protein n=1 Tax=Auriscalpium vulgare TaxID=40419 RepID=A0ACB8R637_9AGAM|nr:hypothetical protein FA95DRAFT_1567181 [Auriscalpium vulgare]
MPPSPAKPSTSAADPDGAAEDSEMRRIVEGFFASDIGFDIASGAQDPRTAHDVPLALPLDSWDDNSKYDDTFGLLPPSPPPRPDASVPSSDFLASEDVGHRDLPVPFAAELLYPEWLGGVLPRLQLTTTPAHIADLAVVADEDNHGPLRIDTDAANMARLHTSDVSFLTPLYSPSTSNTLSTPTFPSPTLTICSSVPSTSASEAATPPLSPIPVLAPSPPQHSPVLSCPQCDWVQANGRHSDLTRHMLTHGSPQLICTRGCGKKFRRRDGLKRHVNNRKSKCARKASRANDGLGTSTME